MPVTAAGTGNGAAGERRPGGGGGLTLSRHACQSKARHHPSLLPGGLKGKIPMESVPGGHSPVSLRSDSCYVFFYSEC